MNDADDDPAAAAFLRAGDKIREAVKDITGWDACLALTICLAECIVFGNSPDDEPDEAIRLAQTVKVLGEVVTDMMAGDDEDGPDDKEPRPSPPSPDLLRRLLERRRAIKLGRE
jgi:hypothetical protein